MDFNPLHFTNPTTCIAEAMALANTVRRYQSINPDELNIRTLVAQTKRSLDVGRPVGDGVVTLRKIEGGAGLYCVENRVAWLVADDGNYVLGAIGIPTVQHLVGFHTFYIYEIEDGVWGMGEATRGDTRRRVFQESEDGRLSRFRSAEDDHMKIIELRRSDGSAPRGLIDAPSHLYRLAPWGMATFPVHGMTESHRNAVLNAAKSEYERRIAMYSIQLQAHRRGWGDEYRQNVRDRGVEFPDPTFVSNLSLRVLSEPDISTMGEELRRAEAILRQSGNSVTVTATDRIDIEMPLSPQAGFFSNQDAIRREASRRLPDRHVQAFSILSQTEFMSSLGVVN